MRIAKAVLTVGLFLWSASAFAPTPEKEPAAIIERTLVYSPAGTDRSAEYHLIEVRVKRQGLNILTRQGYYTGVAR